MQDEKPTVRVIIDSLGISPISMIFYTEKHTPHLILMLLVAYSANTKRYKKPYKMTETLAHGYSSESIKSYQMNDRPGFRWFSKIVVSLKVSSLSGIGRVN